MKNKLLWGPRILFLPLLGAALEKADGKKIRSLPFHEN